jgi:hypothetical protein
MDNLCLRDISSEDFLHRLGDLAEGGANPRGFNRSRQQVLVISPCSFLDLLDLLLYEGLITSRLNFE